MQDKINWQSVPVQYSFCARDALGSARLFQLKPMQTRFGWARNMTDRQAAPMPVYGDAFGYRVV